MQIKDIMNKNVNVVPPDSSFNEVSRKLGGGDGCVFVAKHDRLVGIIADRDIALRCLAGEQITAETTAEQVMSPEMLYCRDTDTTDDVTKLMTANNLQQLAVLDSSKRLVGMVTLGDLSKHLNFDITKTVAQKYHYVARKPIRAAAQKLVEEAGAIADGDPVRLAEKRISDCREAAKKAETQFWREVLIDLIWLEQTPPEIPMIEDGDRP